VRRGGKASEVVRPLRQKKPKWSGDLFGYGFSGMGH